MIDNHGAAVVADLSEFHHIDLVATIRDYTRSPRMLLACLNNLPDTSALHASLRGEPRGWGVDRHYLATTIDAIQNNTWVTAAVASKRKPRKVKPMWRPSKKRSQKVMKVSDLVRKQDDEK